jgi:hypothetical protein
VGALGLRGPGLDLDVQAADRPYDFGGGRIYNLECSGVIRNGGGASGAHSDIAHPEVAHAVWSAALACGRTPAREHALTARSGAADPARPGAAMPPVRQPRAS